MSENSDKNEQVQSDATLGGALFPMSLGLMAGVLFMSCPTPDLPTMQERLQAELSGEGGVYVQDSSVYIRASDVLETIAGVENNQTPDVVYKPNQWVINKSTSTLSFEALQYGQKFGGSFEFGGEIIFDPDDLDNSSVSIEIDISSIATGSLTRDEQARTSDWFDVEAFPKATFKSVAFTKNHDGESYVAHGVLNLRGVDVPIDLPFSLKFHEKEQENGDVQLAKNDVEMLAQISLNRSDFGIGQGEWESEDVVSDKVDVFVVLQAAKP